MAEQNFEVGQKVRIIGKLKTGSVGFVCEVGDEDSQYEYYIASPDWSGRYGYMADELAPVEAPAPSAHASTAAADVPTEQDLYEAFFQNKTYGAVKALFDRQQAAVAAAQERAARLRAALEPFAEAWVQLPLDPGAKLVVEPTNGVVSFDLGIKAKALEDAHTAYFNLAPPDQTSD